MRKGLGVAMVALGMAWACGGDDAPTTPCVPGITRACAGPGTDCYQVCRTDGSGFEPCQCGDAGTGASGGTGGQADASAGGSSGSAGSGLTAGSAGAAASGGLSDRYLAYVAGSAQQAKVTLMTGDSASPPQDLLPSGHEASSLAFSPNGQRLLMRALDPADGGMSAWGLFVAKVSAPTITLGERIDVSTPGTAPTPVSFGAWSPDSTHVAYVNGSAAEPSIGGLFWVDVSGSAVAPPLEVGPPGASVYEGSALWAPSSDAIAYSLWSDGTAYVSPTAKPGTTSPVQFNGDPIYARIPFWHPAGQRLALISTGDLFVVDLSGGEVQSVAKVASANELTAVGIAEAPCLYAWKCMWSASGDLLSYRWTDTANQVLDVVRMVGGGASTQVIDTSTGFLFWIWSPKNDKIAYSATKTVGKFDFFVVDASTWPPSSPQKLSDGTTAAEDVIDAFWSPDGEHIAFLTEKASQEYTLYVVAADGSWGPTYVHANVNKPFLGYGFSPDGKGLYYSESGVYYVALTPSGIGTPIRLDDVSSESTASGFSVSSDSARVALTGNLLGTGAALAAYSRPVDPPPTVLLESGTVTVSQIAWQP